MCDVKIGRAAVTTDTDVMVSTASYEGDTVKLTAWAVGTAAEVTAVVEMLRAYQAGGDEPVVPVVCSCDITHLTGYYRVAGVTASQVKSGRADISIDLERAQGFAAPVLESIIIGGQRSTSEPALVTGVPWHAVPAAAVGYETGILTPSVRTIASETGNLSYLYALEQLPAVTATATTDLVSSAGHGLVVGDLVIFTTLTGGAGLATGTWYYVVRKDANTFKVSASKGGTAINITTNATAGTGYRQPDPPHFYNARPSWFLNPADWYDGAATLTVGGELVAGRQVRNQPSSWVLSNGIVRIKPGANGAVVTERWSGTAWGDSGTWHIGRKVGAIPYRIDPLEAPHTVTVLRNDPACVTIRCAQDAASLIPGARFVVYVDYSLRRGSLVVEVTLSTRGDYTWGFQSPLIYASIVNAYDSTTDGKFFAGGTGEFGQEPVDLKSHFIGIYAGSTRQFDQWGFGYLNGQSQAFVAQQYAAGQSERVQVVAR